MTIDPAKTYTAKLSTSCGDVTVALDAKGAPKSVNNFVFLAKQGFYDGLKWPRAAGGFVIQTGSPTDDQAGGPGYSVKTEVPAPGGLRGRCSGVGQGRQRTCRHRRVAILRRDRRGWIDVARRLRDDRDRLRRARERAEDRVARAGWRHRRRATDDPDVPVQGRDHRELGTGATSTNSPMRSTRRFVALR